MIRVFRHYVPRFSVLLATGEAALFFSVVALFAFTRIPYPWLDLSLAPQEFLRAAAYTAGIVAVTTLTMGATGLYDRDVMFEMDAVLARTALTFSLAFTTFYCIELALSPWSASYAPLYRIAVVAIPACAVAFLLLRAGLAHVIKRENLKRRILVVGRGRSAAKIARMDRNDRCGFRIVGYVDLGSARDCLPLGPLFPDSSFATPEAAFALVKNHHVDTIVIAKDERRGLPHKALVGCRMKGIGVEDFATFWESHAGHVDLDSLRPSWLIYGDGFSMNGGRQFSKIIFDYSVASLLLVATAPITILTAILIKATSQGPIFFRQERVGLNGKIFNVLKFRSMTLDAEKAGPQWAKANDARVTGIGRFIRKVRIDEIPQVINILKGEMSFVGPRPERPHFVPQLSKAIPYFDERHRVKPGLSGWAQINYPYGASIEDARNKLSYDLYYLKNGSIFLDLLILLRTVQVILWPHGAR